MRRFTCWALCTLNWACADLTKTEFHRASRDQASKSEYQIRPGAASEQTSGTDSEAATDPTAEQIVSTSTAGATITVGGQDPEQSSSDAESQRSPGGAVTMGNDTNTNTAQQLQTSATNVSTIITANDTGCDGIPEGTIGRRNGRVYLVGTQRADRLAIFATESTSSARLLSADRGSAASGSEDQAELVEGIDALVVCALGDDDVIMFTFDPGTMFAPVGGVLVDGGAGLDMSSFRGPGADQGLNSIMRPGAVTSTYDMELRNATDQVLVHLINMAD